MIMLQVADEVQINHGDQKMINSFANKNAKFNELKQAAAKLKVIIVELNILWHMWIAIKAKSAWIAVGF